jgi:hypothetical protein
MGQGGTVAVCSEMLKIGSEKLIRVACIEKRIFFEWVCGRNVTYEKKK